MKHALLGAVLATCLTLTMGASPASAQTRTSTPGLASRTPTVWVVGSPDQSFSDQLIATLPTAASTTDAVTVVRGLLATARAGRSPDIPGPKLTSAQAVAQLTALASVLQNQPALTHRQNELHNPSAQGTNITVHPNLVIAPQRGSKINSNRSWTFNTEIAAHVCTPNGCGEDTDDIKQRWTMDPARSADKFSFTSVYFPTTGAFVNIFAHVYSFCGSNLTLPGCGNLIYPPSGPRNGNGNGSFLEDHTSNAGKTLRQEVDMTAHFVPTNSTATDTASTGSALCATGTNTTCPYQ